MIVKGLKCSFCKRDIVLGQRAVSVIVDNELYQIVHVWKCLNELKRKEESNVA